MWQPQHDRPATLSLDNSGMGGPAARTTPEESDLVLDLAHVLHANGQSTHEMVAAVERLSSSLGLRATIIARWGELQLQATYGNETSVSIRPADPTGVDMDRVASAMRALNEAAAGRLAAAALRETIKTIAHAPPAPTWLLTLAAAAGAAALAVIFGVRHIAAVGLIVVSAAAGAVVRRTVAKYSTNTLVQPLCAALLAGIVGALAVRYQLSSSLRLVAVCPCMILVPGPHVLNGMVDLVGARVSLGASRLTYACLIVVAICVGLLLGLSLLHVSAAGVAVAAYSIFFSTPLRMLGWPVGIGMAAHALRWWTLAAGADAATGAFVACLLVGLVLPPVARRYQMPFAAVGFAAVVSMMPGVFLFRMASGLLRLAHNSNTTLDLLGATIADGMTAVTIILAMSFGVIVPKIFIDSLGDRAAGRS